MTWERRNDQGTVKTFITNNTKELTIEQQTFNKHGRLVTGSSVTVGSFDEINGLIEALINLKAEKTRTGFWASGV